MNTFPAVKESPSFLRLFRFAIFLSFGGPALLLFWDFFPLSELPSACVLARSPVSLFPTLPHNASRFPFAFSALILFPPSPSLLDDSQESRPLVSFSSWGFGGDIAPTFLTHFLLVPLAIFFSGENNDPSLLCCAFWVPAAPTVTQSFPPTLSFFGKVPARVLSVLDD